MSAWELAQLNIAEMRGPLESPAMADFVANLDRINATAESAKGFIWRLKTDDGNATALRPMGDHILINVSVWRDVDALKEFVYRSAHAPIMRRRREWFEGLRQANMVLWWVPAGHHPSEAEAIARLEQLRNSGPSADAFTFQVPFAMPSVPANASPPGIRIRAEQPQDQAAIHALLAQCFPTAAEAGLVDALRRTEESFISLVALAAENRIVGHVCFTPVQTSAAHRGMGLAPLAVDESFRRRGVGAALVTSGLARCRQEGFGWAVVLGNPAHYRRFGFRAASEFGLVDTYGGGNAFQALELLPAALPRGAGVVHYAAAFAAL